MKDGAAVTVTAMAIVCVIDPVVAMTVRVKLVPAMLPTKMFIEDLTIPPREVIVTGSGTNRTATPDGTLLFVSATFPVKPPMPVMVRVPEVEDPAGIERDDAAAVILKSDTVKTVAP